MMRKFMSTCFMSRLLDLILGAALFTYMGLHSSPAAAAGVRPLFDLSHPAGGPFPSDRFTVPDARHNTGLRVNLPLVDDHAQPLDCIAQRSSCEDIAVLNELDGFNSLPRISIPFSGDIDADSVRSESVFLISLGSTLPGGPAAGQVVGINRRVWDVETKTLHVESDELLDQLTRYALIVTDGVRDASGDRVEVGDFAHFRHDLNFGQAKDSSVKAYRKALLDALAASPVPESRIVVASVFTTQSVTAVLEKIRDQLRAASPNPADFVIASTPATPGGALQRALIPFANVTTIQFTRQVRVDSTQPLTVNIRVADFLQSSPQVVGHIAFGKFASYEYRTVVPTIDTIPATGSRTGAPEATATTDVYFNLILPACTKPDAGWPVAIFGHGLAGDKNVDVAAAARVLAAHCIATIGINSPGHGFGAGGTLTVNRLLGGPVTVPAGGRGIDQNGDGIIDATEGAFAASPSSLISIRDGVRQTVIDIMQLVRVIEVGMDVDGDGFADLDPSHIYYFGQSLGGIVGTILLPIEPSIRVGVLTVPGGPPIEVALLNPGLNLRGIAKGILASRTPSLLNPYPGMDPLLLGFDENIPLRNEEPRINTIAGAMEVQKVFDRMKWAMQSGDPVAYAPHIRKRPLAGVPAKDVIVQFAKGDLTAPNPTTTTLLRAGDLADRATYFRNDVFVATLPAGTQCTQALRNPHNVAFNFTVPQRFAQRDEAQTQIATFFTSDGVTTIDPDPPGRNFWEVPIESLPETLNFLSVNCVPPPPGG